MKNLKSLFLLAALLVIANSAYALQCNESRMALGSADDCYTTVTVASNETTLVSDGAVLVYDVTNAQFNADRSAFQVRVITASSAGVRVAGVATRSIASGEQANVLVRGKGNLFVKTADTITSGDALFVGASNDASVVTSTTQTQLGFALETSAAAGNTKTLKKAYITIV